MIRWTRFDSGQWIRMVGDVIGFIVIPLVVVGLILYIKKKKKSSG